MTSLKMANEILRKLVTLSVNIETASRPWHQECQILNVLRISRCSIKSGGHGGNIREKPGMNDIEDCRQTYNISHTLLANRIVDHSM